MLIDEADGTEVAAHDVRLDATDWQFEAFADLHQYLSWHVAPDRRGTDDARIVAEVGEWIRTQVFGPVADALAQRALQHHVTVRVIATADAAALLLRPLELAHVKGRPLAAQGITLVMQHCTAPVPDAPVPRDRLRVLGLFSLPEGGQPLNLRRERQALVTLIHGIAEAGKAADVRVLQYGVTRNQLRDVLAEAEGWDIIHISGHGAPGELLLEAADGKPDRITATRLADLLMATREHVRLITVAACWSAADSIADQRRRLGLPVKDEGTQTPDTERRYPPAAPPTPSAALATELADRLNCAVLAMRYPVNDDFAVALSGRLYNLLIAEGQPLPRAAGMTLQELFAPPSGASPSAERAFPALSVATPALFGGSAVGLSLAAPQHDAPADNVGRLKLPGLPPQPEHFVGRVSVMARSSAALALRSGVPGVVLHGMPGGGKTACALELAYGHEHAFDQLAWYKAPDEGSAVEGSLTDFALTLERYVPGFQMTQILTSQDRLEAFLPLLAKLMEERRVLIVIDNAESLLTESGQWRDGNWGRVMVALTGRAGLGRLILTSRRGPAGLPGLQVETVDALSADESLLLSRELPNLSALSRGKVPGAEGHVGRLLARRALAIAQGHPKLLELADGQAAHPERLATLVEVGDQEWRKLGGLPGGFFTAGETTASGDDYLHLLATWTKAVTDTLTLDERDIFWFLCCLEEADRDGAVVKLTWPVMRSKLARDEPLPELDTALAAIAASGLASVRNGTGDDDEYLLHPAIAAAGRAQAGKAFQDAVDAELAPFWTAMYQFASGGAPGGTVNTRLLVHAGLAAVPYLVRQELWLDAATLLDDAFLRNPSRSNATTMLPAIQQIARHVPRVGILAAVALHVIDPAAGEAQIHAYLDAAEATGDYRSAATATSWLADMYLRGGRLSDALAFTERQLGYTRQAGLGPWTQLADEVRRLQVLVLMGQAKLVLAEVRRLRDRMDALPATRGPDEAIPPWTVREALLGIGRSAAIRLDEWEEALDLNAARVVSRRDRGAPAAEIAAARFNDYGPLLRLGHIDQALDLLQDCRQVFEDARDTEMLGGTLAALADIENDRGHGDAAIRLAQDALRYGYLAKDVPGTAVSYHNLGLYHRHAPQPVAALVSHLAAALIRTLSGIGGDNPDSAQGSVRAAAGDLRRFGTTAVPPHNVADLCGQLSGIPGTDLRGLIAALSPDPEAAEVALRGIITRAQDLAAASTSDRAAQPPAASPDDSGKRDG